MSFLAPDYRAGSLADVMPSVLAGMDVPGMANVLGLPAASRVCVLLVDGLGWQLLREHADQAPFLTSLAAGREPISAGFPATTATSVSAIGTGMPPGEHGVVGYSFAVGPDEVLNALGWRSQGNGAGGGDGDSSVDLRDRIVPEQFQPRATAFERAAAAGVAVRLVGPAHHDGSGLNRAALRGGRHRAAHALGDLTSGVRDELRGPGPILCYAYHGDLDLLGHRYGPGSDPWQEQLAVVDQLAARIAAGLPPGGLLVVTADHGMVAVAEQDRVDVDTEPALLDGVRLFGGEARTRHLYTHPGATDDVWRAWGEILGERALVLRRHEAIEAGWFGPRVAEHVRPRIGDVVVAAQGTLALIRSGVEPRSSRFAGHHGSLTSSEQLIPLLTASNSR
ncbi:alkaline phosphatase family protein [Frankia sp. CcI49]|uniref:alkaline phosphatase family protein n=1 Tax=unclassified Frankia TaxID=2632575 RepID=UPI0006CA2673|nr:MULTISPECIES: alkaline phosphatase family protein [unclassified Frankia]KPM55965.1 phosphodiesterase [Frankia sp. R43]ONH58169.1 alkaline phosphatase family protein [Frankia sp. CcI49]